MFSLILIFIGAVIGWIARDKKQMISEKFDRLFSWLDK